MCCTCVCPRPASCSVTQLQNRPPEMSRSVDCAALASALGLLPLSSRSRTTSHPKYHNTKCLRLRLPSATSPPLRVTQRAAGQGSLQCHCKKCRLCCVGACRRCNSESSLVTHQASEPGSLQCHGTRPGCNGPDRDCVDLRPPSELRPPLPLPLFRQFKMQGCGLVRQRRPCKSCQLWLGAAARGKLLSKPAGLKSAAVPPRHDVPPARLACWNYMTAVGQPGDQGLAS